jgi:voltage-gated potassium channel Kch
VLTPAIAEPLVAAVALSMMLTPLIMIVNERLVQPRFVTMAPEREPDEIDDNENPVIIAGFGRFGQIIGRLLIANGYKATLLEQNPAQIDLLRRFGWKVFYGDASRLDLLHAAGAKQARLFVVAIDEPEKTVEIVHLVRKHFPHLKILARASDRRNAYELIRGGADVIQRETFSSALEMGTEVLKLLGVRSYKAHRAASTFQRHDEEVLQEMAQLAGDESALIARSRQMSQDLAQLLQSDDRELTHEVDRAWDISVLRKNA